MTGRSYVAPVGSPILVDAIESTMAPRPGACSAVMGKTLNLSTRGLEDFFFANWQPPLVDLLFIAAAAEYCDATMRRPARGWARAFDVRVAVHDPSLWNSNSVRLALEEALVFLTGDQWSFSFISRQRPEQDVGRRTLDLGSSVRVIIPYSDGLDSRAVAALVRDVERDGAVSVRLGNGGVDRRSHKAFTTVPYRIRFEKRERVEASARSRGFKFAAITGIAALLANVSRIVVSESGQGALGPSLAVSGQIYPDYRVHPAFTRRMENLFEALTSKKLRYEYPRIWSTKGETLRAANELANPPSWTDSRSCWQSSRQVGFQGHRRQCGICAACLLRRLSLSTAGIAESSDAYIWENLSAPSIMDGVAKGFGRITRAQEEYAIAGVLHLDHLAALPNSPLHQRMLKRAARELADALNEQENDAERKLMSLLSRHKEEWLSFLGTLGSQSFVSKIALVSPWR